MTMDDAAKLAGLEQRLAKYKEIFIEKKRNFRGVKHENSLSELRYTEFMVYKGLVESLEKEVASLKEKIRLNKGR